MKAPVVQQNGHRDHVRASIMQPEARKMAEARSRTTDEQDRDLRGKRRCRLICGFILIPYTVLVTSNVIGERRSARKLLRCSSCRVSCLNPGRVMKYTGYV